MLGDNKMRKESLKKTNNMIVLHLATLGIDNIDKTELMMNITRFLNDYDRNIAILMEANMKIKQNPNCWVEYKEKEPIEELNNYINNIDDRNSIKIQQMKTDMQKIMVKVNGKA